VLFRVSLIRRDWDNEIVVGAWNVIPTDSVVTGIKTVSQATARGPEDWLAKASAEPGGYYRKFYLPGLRKFYPDTEEYVCTDVLVKQNGSWRGIGDPAEREDELSVRPVIVWTEIINPQTGYPEVIRSDFYRACDLSEFDGNSVVYDILRQ
jgi:hypothetical protein